MASYVLDLHAIDRTMVGLVGGKGANLGELSRIDGVRVPPGFCVTTEAFRRFGKSAAMPRELAAEITRALADLAARAAPGEPLAYAVRSSATAEDSSTASFAGQHDSYLDVVGAASIIEHVRHCWDSLFTERAVAYRRRNDIGDSTVQMAVVVQRMVAPHASGVLFTADPVTGHRRVTSIEATLGLGEALVSGLVNPDVFKVRDEAVVSKTTRLERPTLTDEQAVRLAALGRRIEAHFGRPQDIEWCLAGDDMHIVQSRPITTLFPIPDAGDTEKHVYISVGHPQMMTDAFKPLGLSMWQLTAARAMYEAGGRLFVDVAQNLASPPGRAALVSAFGRADPLIGDALRAVVERGDLLPSVPIEGLAVPPLPGASPSAPIATDPAIVAELIANSEASLVSLKREIASKSGATLLDFILTDITEKRRILFDPRSLQVIMAGIEAAWWLNDKMQEWLGEKNTADVLTRSAPGNVTSEMGLALLDVADVIRPQPEVVAFLERVTADTFVDELPALAGGLEARDAIRGWLDKYGMRCAGEIDITRPRWSEHPATLVPLLLGHVRNAEPGAGKHRFDRGREESLQKEQDLLARLRALPDGEQRAEETKRMIDRVRTFAGYREYPKYHKVSRDFVYKQALMGVADGLVRGGVIHDREDVFYLRFEELQDVVLSDRADAELIHERKQAFRSHEALTPPRVFTSEGEVITGSYRREDLPAGALVGLGVSSRTVEGRARVILDMADADLEPGDVLVTRFTDPSWTPLFVAIAGLVTEVGGLTTHGAVIAREYGLPAVVGVEDATRLIKDGQRVRVHGADGYVELLS